MLSQSAVRRAPSRDAPVDRGRLRGRPRRGRIPQDPFVPGEGALQSLPAAHAQRGTEVHPGRTPGHEGQHTDDYRENGHDARTHSLVATGRWAGRRSGFVPRGNHPGQRVICVVVRRVRVSAVTATPPRGGAPQLSAVDGRQTGLRAANGTVTTWPPANAPVRVPSSSAF